MLLALLMLLDSMMASPGAGGDRFPEATEIYRCQFDASTDKDFDTWPDGWTRQRGIGFPSYMKIHIHPETSPGGENCLHVDLDGGGAAAFSPPIPININYGYVVEAYIRTEALKYDKVFISLSFLDAEKHTLSISRSEMVVDSGGWKKIRLGTIETSNPDARWAMVGLHVEPGANADLHGGVCFTDIWLGRLPRMELKTDQPHNFFVLPAKPKVVCTVSGIDKRYSEAAFELYSVVGERLGAKTQPLVPRQDAASEDRSEEKNSSPTVAVYNAEWTPSLPAAGFYRIRIALQGTSAAADQREITLVAVEPSSPSPGGIFGWSLPQGHRPLPLPELTVLLEQAGISWVKYPLWCPENDGGRQLEQLLQFVENLNRRGIELAGMLLEPPEQVREKFRGSGPLTAADIFGADPKIWYPSLEPVIIQASHQVHCWQLGRDTDISLMIAPNSFKKLKAIHSALERAMEGMQLGIGWDYRQNLPAGTDADDLPWNIVSLSSDPPLSSRELGIYLDSAHRSPLKSWVVIAPLPREGHSPQERAEDLVSRMAAAKIHGAGAVFCPDPFDPLCGLMNPDGTPGELFMSWRTAAHQLGEAKYLGEMLLPQGSPNWVFARQKDAVMIVWNCKPTEEVIYLGNSVGQTDVWGRTTEMLELDRKQLLKVGREPTFITGVSKPLAEWSVGLQIEQKLLPNVFGQPLPNGYSVKNPFPSDITGKVIINSPKGWAIDPQETVFRLAKGEELKRNFRVNLPSTANSGKNAVRIDFEIQADRPYKFSVYRSLEVGLTDIRMELHTRLNDQKELEVEQRFINDTNENVSFRCELFAPDRRRQMTVILDQGCGENTQVYRIEDGEMLIGQTLQLRATQIEGTKILNYRFEAER